MPGSNLLDSKTQHTHINSHTGRATAQNLPLCTSSIIYRSLLARFKWSDKQSKIFIVSYFVTQPGFSAASPLGRLFCECSDLFFFLFFPSCVALRGETKRDAANDEIVVGNGPCCEEDAGEFDENVM